MSDFNIALDLGVSVENKVLKNSLTSLEVLSDTYLSHKKVNTLSLESVFDIDFLVASTFIYEEKSGEDFSLGTLNNVRVVGESLQLDTFDYTMISESFEDEEFNFNFKGDWERNYWDSERGFVYRSKLLKSNEKSNQKSKLSFIFDLPVNASEAVLSFDYLVSSEKDFDLLVILVNSDPIRVSGDGRWQTATKELYGSNHLVEFIYKKDDLGDIYLDRACVDDIQVSYSLLRPLGYRISPPISLDSINYYKNSTISWVEEETERTPVVVEVSLDGGLTWSTASNGEEIPGFVVGSNYEGQSMLVKTKMRSILSEQSILKSLSIEIDCLSKYQDV